MGSVGCQGGGKGGGGDAADVIAGQESVVDGRAGDGQARQGRADAQSVVVIEQAEQVQGRQVRGAGAGRVGWPRRFSLHLDHHRSHFPMTVPWR